MLFEPIKHNLDYDIRISVIRFASLVLIVLCHFFQYYNNPIAWWFNVGVQIFFIVSGYLHGRVDVGDSIVFLKKKANKILVPYYLNLIIILLLYALFVPEYLSVKNVFKLFCLSGTIPGIGHLWFVGYILFCYFITPYLWSFKEHIIKCKPRDMVKKSLFLIVLVFIIGTAFDSYFKPDKIICYIVGYLFYWFYEMFKDRILKEAAYVFCAMAAILSSARLFISIKGYNFRGLGQYENFSQAVLGIALFLLLFLVSKNWKYNKLFNASDKLSYYIYLTHHVFILGPFSLISLIPLTPYNYLMIIVITIAYSSLLNMICSKLIRNFGKNNFVFYNKLN